jgi:hypothetical protein
MLFVFDVNETLLGLAALERLRVEEEWDDARAMTASATCRPGGP